MEAMRTTESIVSARKRAEEALRAQNELDREQDLGVLLEQCIRFRAQRKATSEWFDAEVHDHHEGMVGQHNHMGNDPGPF